MSDMAEASISLATLRAGQRLRGLVPGQTVTLIAIDPIDAELVEVFYWDDSGRSGARTITGTDVERFESASDVDSAPAEVVRRQMVDDVEGRNVLSEHPFLITRMDQLSRSDDLMEQLGDITWDVAVVDEAHRMSAHHSSWAGEGDETKRFRLGRLLSETAHNFLLITATPHPGKEDLLTFEGKPLFPERKAYTVEYELSPAERDFYDRVTDYVRTEMGRADRISQAGDTQRGNNVGCALTVRTPASSSPTLISDPRGSETNVVRFRNSEAKVGRLDVRDVRDGIVS